MADSDSINSIKRAFCILETLCHTKESMGVTALASALDLPKATVFRILSSLIECGAIVKDMSGKYRLGTIYFRYAERLRADNSLNGVAEPILQALRDSAHEAVNLGILQQDLVVNVLTIPGDSFIITSRALPLSPLYCSAMGKIFLAHMSEQEILSYFNSGISARTVHTIITIDAFMKERESILTNGIAFDREEYEYGLYCIGAPVYNVNNKLIAAISLSGPTSRMEYRGLDQLVKQVSSTALTLSSAVRDSRIMPNN